MKPRIKIWRNFRGEAIWQCIGVSIMHGRHALVGRGKTPVYAYLDWKEACEFPF